MFKPTDITKEKLSAILQENHVACAMHGDGIHFSAHFYHSNEELDKAIALIPKN